MPSSEIKIMRLVTGEEIICDVSTESSSRYGVVYNIKDVAILIPTEANQLGLAPFVPYSTASVDGITLAEKDVMFVTKPVDDLRKQYQNMFSKLMTPNQGIVTS